MKFCESCGKERYGVHPHLEEKGFPTREKKYPSAHEEADKMEKNKFGSKSYKELQKLANKLSKHALLGKNTKTGKIEVSKVVPKKLRNEVAFHEEVENKILRRKGK